MDVLEIILISFFAGVVASMVVMFFTFFFRKGNLWEQGFDDGWNARGESIKEEIREENKV